jgi:hypothetical protein
MQYWIQHADFSSEVFDSIDLGSAIAVVKSHDWVGEHQKLRKMNSVGEECCDPGIGFMAKDGRILHICPDGEGEFYFHYHFKKRLSVFGLVLATTSKLRNMFNLPESMLNELVERFFRNDHDWIVSNSQKP